jgi:hypothetical protein
MLAPNLLNAEEDLAETANVIRDIGGFAQSCMSASLAQQEPPLDWVTDVRLRLADCSASAQRWLKAREQIIPPLSSMFIDYASLVSAAAEAVSRAAPASDWIALLTAMRDAARANSKKATAVQDVFASSHEDFTTAYQEIKLSLQKAQDAETAEREDILEISLKLQKLYDSLAALGVDASGQSMAGGQAVVQTFVTISYQVMIDADTAIPVFNIVTTLFSVSTSVYEAVKDNANIRDLLGQVSVLMAKLSADVRALAATQALVITLDRMNDAYLAATQNPPRINSYWDAEVAKIGIALQALRDDIPPGSMTELASLPTAATVWLQMSKIAQAMAMPDQHEDRVVQLTISASAN